MEKVIAKKAPLEVQESFVKDKHWVSSALFVESFYLSSRLSKNKFSTYLRGLGCAIEKYVRSKYLF